jgi:hypothetical protein
MLMRLVCSIAFIGILLLLVQKAGAQLCQGSLGEPIVNITFGVGSNPGKPLTAATTTYQYTSSECPNDGLYTVVNKTQGCFENNWHTIKKDHTGEKDGYFMLVNASLQPGAFYLDTVRGLCRNTAFELAAWVANVLKPGACSGNGIQPNLTFTIEKTDGTVLQTYNSGNIPPKDSTVWQLVGFAFATPPGISEVVLRIVNNAPGGCGNDLAIDDITFRACGPDIITSIQGISGLDASYCQGPAQSYTFNGSLTTGYITPSLQWQEFDNSFGWRDIPGETGLTLQRSYPAGAPPRGYLYRLSGVETSNAGVNFCKTASKTISITIHPNPVTTARSNSPVCVGNNLMLMATGGAKYDWTGVDGFSSSGASVTIPGAQTTHSGKYKVTVTTEAGCSRDDSLVATVNPSPIAIATADTTTICQGNQVQLTATGGIQYQWTPATNLSSAVVADPVALPDDTTDFTVIAWNGVGCTDTASVTVNVAEAPFCDAGPDKALMKGKTAQLQGMAGGQDVDIRWTPAININDAGSLNPVVSPTLNTNYLLTVESKLGY